MERLSADVLIVGGGIMGCSAALHLRERGRSVVLLERGFVGAQASGVNFGNVRRQGRFLPQLPLAMRSRALWDRLERLVGDRCEFTAHGHLRLAFSDADMGELESHARAARDYGLELELMGRNRVRERWPWLGEQVVGGSLCPDDGSANPRLVTPALARAACRAGADIRERSEVVEIARDGERFVAITASGVEVRAPHLVNAAGAWAHRIAARFGEDVPLVASGPQMGVTEPIPHFIEPSISVVSNFIYLRQIPRGNVIFGGGNRGKADNELDRAYVAPANTGSQLGRLLRVVPALRAAHVIRVWSGIEGYLPDSIPVIGPSATTPGLFHAFGFCGHGFQLGLAVGAVLSELVADGATPTPIAPFAIDRFHAPAAGRAHSLPAEAGASGAERRDG